MSCENMQDGGKKHLKKLSKKTSKKPSSDKKKKTSLRKVKSGCGCQTHTMTGGGCGCGKQKGGSYNVHYSPFYVAPGTVGANTQSWENNQSGGGLATCFGSKCNRKRGSVQSTAIGSVQQTAIGSVQQTARGSVQLSQQQNTEIWAKMTRQQLDDKIKSLMQYIFENTELMNKTNDKDRKRIYKQRIDTRKKELDRILLIQPINGGKKSSKNKISGGSGAVGHTVMPHQYYGAEQPTMSGTGAHITSIDLSGGDAPMARGGIPENFTQSLVGGTKHKSKKSLSKKIRQKETIKKI
jgi:hypothetical protein